MRVALPSSIKYYSCSVERTFQDITQFGRMYRCTTSIIGYFLHIKRNATLLGFIWKYFLTGCSRFEHSLITQQIVFAFAKMSCASRMLHIKHDYVELREKTETSLLNHISIFHNTYVYQKQKTLLSKLTLANRSKINSLEEFLQTAQILC